MYTIGPIRIEDQQFEPDDETLATIGLLWDGAFGQPPQMLMRVNAMGEGVTVQGQNEFLIGGELVTEVQFHLRSQSAPPGPKDIVVELFELAPTLFQQETLQITVSPD